MLRSNFNHRIAIPHAEQRDPQSTPPTALALVSCREPPRDKANSGLQVSHKNPSAEERRLSASRLAGAFLNRIASNKLLAVALSEMSLRTKSPSVISKRKLRRLPSEPYLRTAHQLPVVLLGN
jgi:hypothetical protein